MAKFKEKEEAIRLRKLNKSYREIRETVRVSKSSLTLWLKDYPLPLARVRELRDWNERRIERYRETRRKNREILLGAIYEKEKKIIFPFSTRDIFIAGLFLYWGEGGKTQPAQLCLSNTNPAVIKMFIYWLIRAHQVDQKKIRVKLHLYHDMNIKKEVYFWSKELHIPASQFTKPYIKNSTLSGLTYKNGFGHGTCNVMISGAILGKRIMMSLRAVEDYFNKLTSV
jgi:hypothetical protein